MLSSLDVNNRKEEEKRKKLAGFIIKVMKRYSKWFYVKDFTKKY